MSEPPAYILLHLVHFVDIGYFDVYKKDPRKMQLCTS